MDQELGPDSAPRGAGPIAPPVMKARCARTPDICVRAGVRFRSPPGRVVIAASRPEACQPGCPPRRQMRRSQRSTTSVHRRCQSGLEWDRTELARPRLEDCCQEIRRLCCAIRRVSMVRFCESFWSAPVTGAVRATVTTSMSSVSRSREVACAELSRPACASCSKRRARTTVRPPSSSAEPGHLTIGRCSTSPPPTAHLASLGSEATENASPKRSASGRRRWLRRSWQSPIDLCWQPAVYITEPSPTDPCRRSRPTIGQSRSLQPRKPSLVPGRPLMADAPRIAMRRREREHRSREGSGRRAGRSDRGRNAAARSRWRTKLA